MGFFKTKKITNLDDIKLDDTFPESDFATVSPGGKFVQLEYIEEDAKRDPYPVKPGIWAIQKTSAGLKLLPTSFVSDKILESFVNTKVITDKIDCFFNKLNVYRDLGFEVPKRGMLLFGPAGSGKSTAINAVATRYVADNKTAIIIWHTDKFEPYQVKDFFQRFEYEAVEKVIVIVEDIGGVEIEQARMKSDPSLLSLLDNQEKTFKIPVFILATTNNPENFHGNLTNRPNRFDDKIEVGFPDAKSRRELLKFFSKTEVSEEVLELMESSKTQKFTPAHIRECVIRSLIYDKDMKTVINEIAKEIETYNKNFENKNNSVGFHAFD